MAAMFGIGCLMTHPESGASSTTPEANAFGFVSSMDVVADLVNHLHSIDVNEPNARFVVLGIGLVFLSWPYASQFSSNCAMSWSVRPADVPCQGEGANLYLELKCAVHDSIQLSVPCHPHRHVHVQLRQPVELVWSSILHLMVNDVARECNSFEQHSHPFGGRLLHRLDSIGGNERRRWHLSAPAEMPRLHQFVKVCKTIERMPSQTVGQCDVRLGQHIPTVLLGDEGSKRSGNVWHGQMPREKHALVRHTFRQLNQGVRDGTAAAQCQQQRCQCQFVVDGANW
ncbi:hypothetical protein niasHS_000835 [Heterodera schachtii]|uniref:Uncharacterized protein n=1 Tax=Heterodera schachtii TaxID=97005 RepID=A0ABD2KLW2_HETSC